MKYLLTLHLFFCYALTFSQNYEVKKIIIDKNSNSPLEDALIFNDNDNSTTNSEGKFIFVSKKNEINLKLLGYTSIKTTFDQLNNSKDTIFMEAKSILLEEVSISNVVPFMKKVYAKLGENYLANYTANFYLRNELKKDNNYQTLQDIQAKVYNNSNEKKKMSIEILNMRKTSLLKKKRPCNV